MKQKLKEWLLRYGPPEAVGIFLAIITASAIMHFTGNALLMAFVVPWAENIGYYGLMIFNDFSESRKRHKNEKKKFTHWSFMKVFRNLAIEFGPAEFSDSLIIRPICMFYFPMILGNLALGIFVGSMIANVFFYAPTIISYELRKKHLKD